MSDATSDPVFGAGSSQDPFQAAKASAMKAAEDLRTAASQKAQEFRAVAEEKAQQFKSVAQEKAQQFKSVAQERAGEFREYADQALQDAQARYADIRDESEKYIREKPVQAVLTAFGVGLFIGLILRR